MKRFALSLLLLALAAVIPGYAQDLATTQEWITNSLRPSGPNGAMAISMNAPALASDSNGYNFYSATHGTTHYIELITSFTFQSCHAEVKKLTEMFEPGMFAGEDYFRSTYVENFDLHDIDPTSVVITEDPLLISFKTTNNRPLIQCKATDANVGKDFGKDAGCIPKMNPDEALRVNTKEYAVRLSKALKHAVILCGGKKSAF